MNPKIPEIDWTGSTTEFINLIDFLALASDAFTIMMQRQWHVVPATDNKWRVETGRYGCCQNEFDVFLKDLLWDNPFVALVEAEKHYKDWLFY